ncbi:MAG: 50S ribosomal protein L15 [Gemmataceae bacterium]
MDLQEVHRGVHKRRKRKRVGRGPGSGKGKTAGRGHKGQYATSGSKWPGIVTLFEGGQTPLFRRMPKRGFTRGRFERTFHVVNVGDLNEKFDDGATIDPQTLARVGLAKGPADGVRILGEGDVTKKFTVHAHHFSKSAKAKIEAAGGTTVVEPGPKKPVKNKMKPKPTPSEE